MSTTMIIFPLLHLGSTGPGVQNWQRFLNSNERGRARPERSESEALVPLPFNASLAIDGAFGPKTDRATRAWQSANNLQADGWVGPGARAVAVKQGYIPFLPAKNFTATTGRTIDLIVIHDMEYPETPTGAEWCAGFFAGLSAPRASAHYSVDNDSIVQSVRDSDVAWHAPGANSNGIGIEHAGYAKQSRSEWLDDYSRAELTLSARLVSRLCKTYGIPLEWRDASALKKRGARGITGHSDVSRAFGGTHWDPGPNFPIDFYLALVGAS